VLRHVFSSGKEIPRREYSVVGSFVVLLAATRGHGSNLVAVQRSAAIVLGAVVVFLAYFVALASKGGGIRILTIGVLRRRRFALSPRRMSLSCCLVVIVGVDWRRLAKLPLGMRASLGDGDALFLGGREFSNHLDDANVIGREFGIFLAIK